MENQEAKNEALIGGSALNAGLAALPTIGTCLAARFEAMCAEGTIESFSEEMSKFINETADELGDFIGTACGNPNLVMMEFGERLVAACEKRIMMEAANT